MSGAAHAVDGLADLFWAGFLGSRALASVGVALTWVSFFNTARGGLDTSARAMIARAVGAGDLAQANHIARQSLFVNASIALTVMGLGILLSESLLRILGVTEAVVEEGTAYTQLRFLGFFWFGMNQLTSNLLNAGGDTFTPMKSQLVTRGSHMVLSPVLLFGWLGLPALGVSGIAIATSIAQALGTAMNCRALLTGTSKIHITLDNWSMDWPVIRQMVRIGTPAAITGAERSFAQLILVGLAAPFGAPALAVYSIIQRIQIFGSLGAQGASMAGGVIVGQSLGAKQPARAKATVWWTLGFVTSVQMVICAGLFFFPEAVLFLFSRDPAVIEIGVPWLRLEALSLLLLGLGNALVQCLNTAGDTVVPMVASLGTLWGVQQPVAILLTGVTWAVAGQSLGVPTLWNIGVLGIPIAILAASGVRVAILFGYFLVGPWWKKEVLIRSGALAAAH
ncbi:MAG: MATE family efflux transporter [Chloroflexi bacterium]|nr:MATE family efflux transporter [Chloroflexota bacterium]